MNGANKKKLKITPFLSNNGIDGNDLFDLEGFICVFWLSFLAFTKETCPTQRELFNSSLIEIGLQHRA